MARLARRAWRDKLLLKVEALSVQKKKIEKSKNRSWDFAQNDRPNRQPCLFIKTKIEESKNRSFFVCTQILVETVLPIPCASALQNTAAHDTHHHHARYNMATAFR
jgi:hypothetical protein